jgi:periplasmic protein CpxP/Spy
MTTRRLWPALALAALSMPMLAQRPRPMGDPGGGEGRRLEFLSGYLTLSETQKTQAKAIFDAAASAGQTLRGQARSAREALQTAVKSGGADTQLDQLAAALGTVEGQMAAVHAKTESKLYALLSTEQKEKYDNMRHGRGGPRGHEE